MNGPYPQSDRRGTWVRRFAFLLAVAAYLLVPAGIALYVAGFDDYYAGNLVLIGGLCLIVGITIYQFVEKRRYR